MATEMGWAAGDLAGSPQFGSMLLGEPGASHGARFLQAQIELGRLVKFFKPKLIVYEQTIAGGDTGSQSTPQLAMGYRAQVELVAFLHGVKTEAYAVNSIRKHFINHGGLQRDRAKALTMEHCIDLGWPVDNDNEADALAVWDKAGCEKGFRRTPVFGGLFSHKGNAL